MKSKQVNKNNTFLVRLDRGWYKILMNQKAETGRSIKDLVEEVLGDYYGLVEPVAKAVIGKTKDGK